MKLKSQKGVTTIAAFIIVLGIGLILDSVIYLYSLEVEGASSSQVIIRAPKNLNVNQSDFVCPELDTIDCMPIVPKSRGKLCSGSYHDWIAKNCPEIKFTY